MIHSESKLQRILLLMLCYSAAFLSLLWPAIYNGQALFFTDTLSYLNGPAHAIGALMRAQAEWMGLSPSQASSELLINASSSDSVNGGRSIYYGFMIFSGYQVGGLWFSLLLQASIVLAALRM